MQWRCTLHTSYDSFLRSSSVVVCSSTEVSFTAAIVDVLCVFKMVKTHKHTNNTSVAALSDEAASLVVAIKSRYDDLKGEIVSLKILLSY